MEFNYAHFRGLLAEKNISTKDLAKKIDRSWGLVYRWRSGVSQPGLEEITSLAKELKIKEQELLK